MRKVKLKKTGSPEVGYYGSKGRKMITPASYDIYLDGVKIGELWGYSQTRISDGGSGHRGKAFGVLLSNPGVKGVARKKMEEEIANLAESQAANN